MNGLTKPELRLVLKTIHGPATTNPKLAAVYEKIQRMLQRNKTAKQQEFDAPY